MTRVKSLPPIVMPKTVRHALLIVCTGLIPLNRASTAARASLWSPISDETPRAHLTALAKAH